MGKYGTMVWFESWWNTIARIEDPVVRDDRVRRIMKYGFQHEKDLDGLTDDAKAFLEEIFAKMDDVKQKHDGDVERGRIGGTKHGKYDYEGLGVRQLIIEGLGWKEIERKTGIPSDSLRKWKGREEAERARDALNTGKSFPVKSGDIPETSKTFPVSSRDIPETPKNFR